MTGGIILLDKPQGMTSFDADKIVRIKYDKNLKDYVEVD